jgi:hypothetical protein
MLRIVAAAWLALQATGAAATEPLPSLGRLFMTPEWRASLERQRQHNIQETRSLESGNMRLDGVVVRSSGKSTVWVNNRPQTESAVNMGVLATPARQQPGRAILSTGVAGAEEPVDLKVGESINRATRETDSGLTDGDIRVHRPASRR